MLTLVNSCRYEEKRWVARDGKPKSPSRGREEKASTPLPERPISERPTRFVSRYAGSSERSSEEKKTIQPPITKDTVPAARVTVPAPPSAPEPVSCYIFFLLISVVPILILSLKNCIWCWSLC